VAIDQSKEPSVRGHPYRTFAPKRREERGSQKQTRADVGGGGSEAKCGSLPNLKLSLIFTFFLAFVG
jgi:hypothetical protein